MSAALAVRGLKAGYGGKHILHGVDLDVPAGTALTIVGPNGSGKSTLLKAIAGLVPALDGTIQLGDTPITRLDARARARLGLAYVPQESNIFRNMSVRENLRLGWEFRPDRRTGAPLSYKLDEILDLFPEILPHLNTPAGLLSGGQRQMVAVASAMMLEPRLLVLDEPSAGLSPRNASLLFEIIDRIRGTGLTLLMIEQNVQLGLAAADHGLVLVMGRVRRTAAAAELAADDTLAELFLSADRRGAPAQPTS
ncbi:ABC transporter ATP-binding protein [Castellaniella sp. GW247-6E4]|uniref:ABC transporter ATP-binding protein n=1 Tax=Castellaniella sp. GW247-6E4 TaxID=3140380 RepID=UPI00331540CB